MIQIRKATVTDIDAIMDCYAGARRYMRANGNLTQWPDSYPSRGHVVADIAADSCYIGEDEEGELAMVFAFIIGDDPTYAVIEQGEWLNSLPYGTIHRLASTGIHGGMLKTCVQYCLTRIGNLRLDTHADNSPMRHGAEKLGFTRCGTIYCDDGTPRIAYQRCDRTDMPLSESAL